MDTKLLKQKILDLAIRGKLVPQDPNDEPASVLLERIRAEREKLIAEGKLKQSKKTSYNQHYENVPFEIPNTWEWVHLGEIYLHNTGKALNAKNKEGNLRDYITTSNLYWNRFELTEIRQMLFTDKEIERCLATKGDLLVCEGGDVGRAAIWNYDYDIYIQNHIHRLRGILPLCQKFYYYIFFYYKAINLIGGKGTAIQGLSSDSIDRLLIPLPSLIEQERIVSEIERWFVLIDNLNDFKIELQEAIKQTKSRILDLAIHGKLVPQDSSDEPASEMLKRIAPHAKPCDNSHYGNLPSGWCVCSIKDVFDIIMGSSPSGSTLNKEKDGVEFHQGKMCFTDKYLKKSDVYTYMPTKLAEANSILLCVRAPVGIVNITEREICIGRGLCSLKPKAGIDFMFAYYALQTHKEHFVEQASGSTFNAIGGDTIRNEFFILPPYKEQIRIHEKIENILQQLNTINVEL